MPLPIPVNPTPPEPQPPEPQPQPTPPSPAPQPAPSNRTRFLPAAPLPVSGDTPFRALGDVAEAIWNAECDRQGSPWDSATRHALWTAAQGGSAIILNLGVAETNLGKHATYRNNWLDLRERTSLAFMQFPSPGDCLAELLDRWSDRAYKGGIYQPQTQSLADFYGHYSPPNENPTEQLIANAVSRINDWRGAAQPQPNPDPGNVIGTMVPWPNDFHRAIVKKPPSGNGWDALGDRRHGMLGTVDHITDGDNTPEEIVTLFGPGGGRYDDALTEAVIGRNGVGYLMNDPWSADPMEGSGRAPWASGPADGLEGPGIPFVQQFGANAVNQRMFATEHCGKAGWLLTDPQADLSCRVNAVVITREGIPWADWPYNKGQGRGLLVALEHRDISTKTCPAWPASQRQALIDGTRLEAKKLQGSGASPPGPVEPPTPPSPFPFDFTQAQIAAFWRAYGGLKRYGADGGTTVYGFDPAGPIGAIWLARARTAGTFPAALEWFQDSSGWNFVTFGSPGNVDWVLALPDLDSRADWRWVDRPEPAS